MIQSLLRRYLLPLTLGLLGLFLLLRVFSSDALLLLPEDIDVLLLVSLVGLAMAAAIHTIVGISMRYLRWLNIQQARRETLAEHGRFLRRLDHELKNPLTTLRAGISTLSLTRLDDQQRHLIQTMEAETLRLSRLVTDLRKLADLEAQPLNLQPVNIEEFVAHILQVEQDRFEASERKLAGQVNITRTEWLVDEDLLALAVHNLLDNALKYTRPTDSVRLEVAAQNELTFRVIDTGSGIPPEALPNIWEELYRTEQGPKAPGSGIGLALVKIIVERHHGRVEVRSELGRGTAVSIRLPPISHA